MYTCLVNSALLNIRGLTKTFRSGPHERVHALNGVDLDVAEGEFLTVLGPSGCGKTTLLRTIAGFETPDAGSIHVAGRAIAGPNMQLVGAHERGIGVVPQEGALFPHLSVADNVAFGLRHLRRRERRARVEEVLELVDLTHIKRRRPFEISGGQQQRVALARALAPRPRVILLDEPFSALDAYLRDSLRLAVRDLLQSLNTTAILVTHDQQEALSLGDRVAIMREGNVVQLAKPRDAYYRACDLDLARFLGDAVIVDGEVVQPGSARCQVKCAFGDLPVSNWHGVCGTCRVMIRPENIRVSPAALGADTDPMSATGVVGTIVDHTFYGHDGTLRVRVPNMSDDVLVRVSGDQPFANGDHVKLIVDQAVSTYAPEVVSMAGSSTHSQPAAG